MNGDEFAGIAVCPVCFGRQRDFRHGEPCDYCGGSGHVTQEKAQEYWPKLASDCYQQIAELEAHIEAQAAEIARLKAQNAELGTLWSQVCKIAQKWDGQLVTLRYGDNKSPEDADD